MISISSLKRLPISGKRYTRQDLIGTPFCIKLDQQTLEDNTVISCYRETMEQVMGAISDLHEELSLALGGFLRGFRI